MIKTTKDFNKERSLQGQNINLINLGCARNTVDSQTILTQLKKRGHRFSDLESSEVAIVNTCAFIDEAKQESLDTIVELIDLKKKGKIKKVIVAGCLAQRYSKELSSEFKDIDAIIGAQTLLKDKIPSEVSLTPKHFAYVKISESCYNQCRFCIIPKIKGKFVSRTIESICEEVKQLDAKGVREINIIGQDITAYGMDLYHQYSLARLLKEIVKVTSHIQWIRLLYTFPAHVTDELIEVMAREERICKYIDMPLQHISDRILNQQNRSITTDQTLRLIDKLRKAIPEGSLRTTFIVGLPGETDQEFEELVKFVQETRFEKMGAFIYSREEGTPAFDMPNQISDKIKRARLKRLMETQKNISQSVQESYIGRTLKVLIEEQQPNQKNLYLGRSQYDAPDVDGLVYVKSDQLLTVGEFVDVKVNDAFEYDLEGEVV